MQFNTTRFGTIEIGEEKLIHFPLGLLGFENLQRFLVIDSDESAPLRWLQAVDDPQLAFLIAEPTLFFPDYKFQMAQEDLDMLGIKQGNDVVVACLVVVPTNPSDMTINLMGPLVMNPERRVGKQVVLHDGTYSPRQRLLPDAAASEAPAALV